MTAIQSIHLLWQRELQGVLGIPRHAVADDGSLALAIRDDRQHAIELFDYELHRLANGHTRPDAEHAGVFAIDGIRRLEFVPHGQMAVAITDKEFFLIRFKETGPEQYPYLPGRGLVFLDASVACSDPRRTIAFLLQDRSSGSFTLTVAEAKDKLTPIWAKSWNPPVSCIAISADGDWLAVGHANGAVSLLDRGRRVRWEHTITKGRPVASLAVDSKGSVVVADPSGEVRRHEPQEGVIIWRTQLAEQTAPGARVSYRVTTDRNTSITAVVKAVLSQNGGDREADASRYYLLDGATGGALWEDSIGPRPTGIAISPSGEYLSISTLNAVHFFWVRLNGTRADEASTPSLRRGLLEKAKKEAHEGHYFDAVPLLAEALDADPTNMEAAALYEEATWQLRETVMELTTQTTPESLAMVEAALLLLPHNEKLTMRRNALARILANKRYEDGERFTAAGQYREAIAAYREAVHLDASSIEARRAIVKGEERILRGVLQKVQAVIGEARWDEALSQLEEARALRPNSPEISAMIEGIQRDQAYAEGMRYYNAQRYPEAVFQFKRTLMLDAGHMEAARHLSLAETHLRHRHEPEKQAVAGSAAEPHQAPR